jgi:serine/threonine-protein kinase
MSPGEPADTFDPVLTPTAIERLDAACDGFEAAWKAGRRPRIEDVLESVFEPARTGLLRDLLTLDLAYRRLAGERPTPGDYLGRFPAHEATIRAAFDAAAPTDPPPAAPGADADRNLLFGVLALQMDFIGRDALIAAMQAWAFEKSRPLGRILVGQGALGEEDYQALERLVRRHLARHGDSPRRSLATLGPIGPAGEHLARLDDPDVQASLCHLVATPGAMDDPGVTRTAAPGDVATGADRFRILRPHGRGGIGQVSVALDGELHREVALKEIAPRFADDPASRARFLLEAEVTGRLEHPGIVPVYSLGRHGDGRPYYAMRFVRGDSLKDAIDRFHRAGGAPDGDPGARALEFRKLLGRFVAVCDAVAYAHSRGVIYRDIKPSNILLGPYGETLVADWGLAKVVGRDEPADGAAEVTLRPELASSSSETLPGTAVGTPAFMSPEQAGGRLEALGPASDVYSLGATLYCLITGRSPVDDTDVGHVLRRVRAGDFPLPRAVRADAPRALEAVCLRAMAREPSSRYRSARELADDIERWLAGEAVSSWREPWSVRARRQLARHRTLATSAAVAALAAIVGLGFIAVLQDRSNRQLDAKNRELSSAKARAEGRVDLAVRAIENFRKAVEENVDVKNRPELAPLRKALLRSPQDFYRELRRDIEASREAQPESLARLAQAEFGLAEITKQIDSVPDAIRSYQEAIDILSALARGQPAATTYRSDLAQAYYNLGSLQSDAGRPGEGRAQFERARALLEALVRNRPDDVSYRVRLALLVNALGVFHSDAQRMAEARVEYERALEILDPVARDHPSDVGYRSTASRIYNNLGYVLRSTGHWPEARVHLERACDLREALVRDQPEADELRAGLAFVRYNLGELLHDHGLKAEASAHYERAGELWMSLAREHPTVTKYRAELGRLYGLWGYLQWGDGRLDEARKNLELSRAIREELVREHPDVLIHQTGMGWTYLRLGQVHRDSGRLAAARADLERARDALEVGVRMNPDDIFTVRLLGNACSDLGDVLVGLGRARDALPICRRGIDHQRRAFERNTANKESREGLSEDYFRLARLLRKLGRPAEAAAATLERQRLWPADHEELYRSALDLAQCVPLVGRGRAELTREERTECRRYADQALDALRRAIAAGLSATLPPTTPDLDSPRARVNFPALVMDAAFPDDPFAR